MEQLYASWLQSLSQLPISLDGKQVEDTYKLFCETLSKTPTEQRAVTLERFSTLAASWSSLLQQVQQATNDIFNQEAQTTLEDMDLCIAEAEEQMKFNITTQKKRKQHDPSAVATLTEWFDSHTTNPYPNSEEKQHLSSLTGMTISQIETWFSNTRRRKKN